MEAGATTHRSSSAPHFHCERQPLMTSRSCVPPSPHSVTSVHSLDAKLCVPRPFGAFPPPSPTPSSSASPQHPPSPVRLGRNRGAAESSADLRSVGRTSESADDEEAFLTSVTSSLELSHESRRQHTFKVVCVSIAVIFVFCVAVPLGATKLFQALTFKDNGVLVMDDLGTTDDTAVYAPEEATRGEGYPKYNLMSSIKAAAMGTAHRIPETSSTPHLAAKNEMYQGHPINNMLERAYPRDRGQILDSPRAVKHYWAVMKTQRSSYHRQEQVPPGAPTSRFHAVLPSPADLRWTGLKASPLYLNQAAGVVDSTVDNENVL